MKIKTRIIFIFIIVTFVLMASCKKSARESTQVLAFKNGLWFNGESFEKGDWYCVENILTRKVPSRVKSIIDLKGGYVVPPFAEGHNHILEPELIDTYIQLYLDKGIFYVKDQNNTMYSRSLIGPHLNKPTSFDFISANQGFTGPGGHPIQIALQLQQLGTFPKEWTMEDINGNAVFIVETAQDIKQKWQQFLSGKPDFVKIFLQFSEEYKYRRDNHDYLYNRAMNPELIASIVNLAKKSGLKVSAHTYSAEDFHNAVMGGVNQIAHLPGMGYDAKIGVSAFLIKDEDAAMAAKNNVTVLTTICGSVEQGGREYVDNIVLPNLKILEKYNVKILIGSDLFRRTSAVEAKTLSEIGFFDNLRLLKMWCIDTPLDIFPERKIGYLKEGFEASFLVLEGNPIENFKYTQQISLRVKQGQLISPKEYNFPPIGK